MNILFDLDGTLTDPGVGIKRRLQHALARLGRGVPAAETLRRFVGPPLYETFAELLQTADGEVVDAAVRFYRERYVETGMFENELYPGVPEGLESLAQDGHRRWVVTSKPTVYPDRIVDHVVLWGYGTAHELREAEPDHLATSMREVRQIITREGEP